VNESIAKINKHLAETKDGIESLKDVQVASSTQNAARMQEYEQLLKNFQF